MLMITTETSTQQTDTTSLYKFLSFTQDIYIKISTTKNTAVYSFKIPYITFILSYCCIYNKSLNKFTQTNIHTMT